MKKTLFFIGALWCLMISCKQFNTSTDYNVVISNNSKFDVNGSKTGEIKGDHSDERSVADENKEIYFDYEAALPKMEDFEPRKFVDKRMYEKFTLTDLDGSSRAITGPLYDTGKPSYNVDDKIANCKLNDEEKFWVINYSIDSIDFSDKFEEKNAKLAKQGKYCNVWYVTDDVYANNTTKLGSLQQKFDSIYEVETKICGKHFLLKNEYCYVNILQPKETDKINILVLDIDDDGDKGNVLGFFYNLDFYSTDSQHDEGLEITKYSNQTEIFYIDSYYLENQEETIYSTLAHEFNHMLNYVNKTCKIGETNDTWFTEMLAMSVEDILQDKLNISDSDSPKGRISSFNVGSNIGFKTQEFWDTAPYFYAAYANAFAFGAYLTRNYGGVKLLKEIATNSEVNEAAITKALKTLGYSETFDSVFAKFGEVFINPKGKKSIASLNKSVSQTIGTTQYNLSKIDITKNYLGTQYLWNQPRYYEADDYEFILYSSGFVVKEVVSNVNWSERKIKNQNPNLSYGIYN